MGENMKLTFEDYKQYCKENNLLENRYTSLAKFVKEVKMRKEVRLINLHLNRLDKPRSQDELSFLGGLR